MVNNSARDHTISHATEESYFCRLQIVNRTKKNIHCASFLAHDFL